jgi:hypothetical protein
MLAVNRSVTTSSQIEGVETLPFRISCVELIMSLEQSLYEFVQCVYMFFPSGHGIFSISMQVLGYLSEMRRWMTCFNILSQHWEELGEPWKFSIRIAGVLIA